eukprot:3750962-Pleurochrysis_carterae.AAC.2
MSRRVLVQLYSFVRPSTKGASHLSKLSVSTGDRADFSVDLPHLSCGNQIIETVHLPARPVTWGGKRGRRDVFVLSLSYSSSVITSGRELGVQARTSFSAVLGDIERLERIS